MSNKEKVVITTVGTSLFTNYMDKDFKNAYGEKKEYYPINDEYELLKEIDYSFYDDYKYKDEIECIKENIQLFTNNITKENGKWVLKDNCKNFYASAELNSLHKILQENDNNKLIIYLICTDTVLSYLSAEIIKENFSSNKFEFKEIKVIPDLQVLDSNRFKNNGLLNLFEEIKNIKETHKNSEVIINSTGGYKAVIPYLTIIGTLYSLELKYIYENSDTLITIPRLPVSFDWSKSEKYYYFLKDNEDRKYNKDKHQKIIDEMKEFQLISVNEDNSYEITALGKFFEKEIKEKMDLSDNVFGFIFEYKLFEYFYENYKDYDIKRSYKIKENINDKKGNEIDLLLENRNQKEIIFVESKSSYIMKDFKTFKEQISKQLKTSKEEDILPNKYFLCLYQYEEIYEEDINKELKDVLIEIFENEKIEFKLFMFSVDLTASKSNENPYKSFISKKIEPKRELTLEDLKKGDKNV